MNAVPDDDTPRVPFLIEMIGKEMYAAINRPKYKVGSTGYRSAKGIVEVLSLTLDAFDHHSPFFATCSVLHLHDDWHTAQ
jgi:hypothetical protein